ncbi:MAG: hypothetical protein Q9160_003173 [Pyrenula sp. 1 TL-2023]
MVARDYGIRLARKEIQGRTTHFPSIFSPRYSSTSTNTIRALPENASNSASWAEDLRSSGASPEALYPSSELQAQAEIFNDNAPVEAVSEHIGYLKELGIDFGWGTTGILQFWLEHAHIWTGLSWTSCVILTAFVTRLILMKPLMKSSHTSAKLQQLAPVLQPLRTQAQEQLKKGDRQEYMATTIQLRDTQRAAGVKALNIFLPMLLQMPIGFGLWRLCNALANYPVPSLTTESFLWISDLTHPDPYYALPAITAFIMYRNMKSNVETGGANATGAASSAMQTMGKFLPFVSGFFFAYQAALVQVNFFFTTLLLSIVGAILRNAAFRRRFGLAAFTSKSKTSSNSSNSRSGGVLELRKSTDGRTFTADASAAAAAEDKNALDRLVSRFRAWRQNQSSPSSTSTTDKPTSWLRNPIASLQRVRDGKGAIWDLYSNVTGRKAQTQAERRNEMVKSRRRTESVRYEKDRRGEEERKRLQRESEVEAEVKEARQARSGVQQGEGRSASVNGGAGVAQRGAGGVRRRVR